MKWGKNLCMLCNNKHSQPFDNAYDKFIAFMFENGGTLDRAETIDWIDIYGSDWEIGAQNLSRRYFVKQFGCMMAI